MSAQSHYHGTQDDDKNLATMEWIFDLQDQIDNFSSEGMICWPDTPQGAKLNNSNDQSLFTLNHPEMKCKDVCIYDTTLSQWVSAGVNDLSSTETQIIFGEPPDSGRYCVFIRGVPVANNP